MRNIHEYKSIVKQAIEDADIETIKDCLNKNHFKNSTEKKCILEEAEVNILYTAAYYLGKTRDNLNVSQALKYEEIFKTLYNSSSVEIREKALILCTSSRFSGQYYDYMAAKEIIKAGINQESINSAFLSAASQGIKFMAALLLYYKAYATIDDVENVQELTDDTEMLLWDSKDKIYPKEPLKVIEPVVEKVINDIKKVAEQNPGDNFSHFLIDTRNFECYLDTKSILPKLRKQTKYQKWKYIKFSKIEFEDIKYSYRTLALSKIVHIISTKKDKIFARSTDKFTAGDSLSVHFQITM